MIMSLEDKITSLTEQNIAFTKKINEEIQNKKGPLNINVNIHTKNEKFNKINVDFNEIIREN